MKYWNILLFVAFQLLLVWHCNFRGKKYGSNHSKSRISTYCWKYFAELGLQRSSCLWADQQVLPRNSRKSNFLAQEIGFERNVQEESRWLVQRNSNYKEPDCLWKETELVWDWRFQILLKLVSSNLWQIVYSPVQHNRQRYFHIYTKNRKTGCATTMFFSYASSSTLYPCQ